MNRKISAPIAIIFVLFYVVVFLWPNTTYAADKQKCTQSETCKIGEFLYNDDYTENTTSSCTITSRDPSGSLYLSAIPLTQANAYYSHSFTPTTLGTYPTQVCCTVDSQLMCLDKTFEVIEAVTGGGSSLTAADVWSYSDRSLTSFGNLVSDIWDYSSRSLTQSITVDTTYVATKTEITEISKINQENRILLEKLVNKPIVESFIDEIDTQDASNKVTETKSVLDSLFSTSQNLKTKALVLSSNWSKLNSTQITSELKNLQELITSTDPKNQTTIQTHNNWLKTTWSNDIYLELSEIIASANNNLTEIITDSNSYNTSNLHTSFQNIVSEINNIDNLIGNSLDDIDQKTAFGEYKKVTDQLASFKSQSDKLNNLLTGDQTDLTSLQSAIDQIHTEVLGTNNIPSPQIITNPPSLLNKNNLPALTQLKNKIYSLISLVELNKRVTLGDNSKPSRLMWLEEGSIVFRTVASNPSRSLAQTATVKFYLPTEIKKEQIIASDPELKIDYDATEGTLYASAEIYLMPQESKTLTIETEDLWQFSQDEIDILKSQATELVEALKGTPLYTQASSTKSDITATLDKILVKQKQATTPENRIKTYRESSLEIIAIEEKIDSLKFLIAQSNITPKTASSQNLAIIGVILLGIAGFTFLSYYLKLSKQHNKLETTKQTTAVGERPSTPKTHSRHLYKESHNVHHRKIATLVVLGLIGSGAISLIGSFTINTLNYQKSKKITLETTEKINKNQIVSLIVDQNQKIPVKSGPSLVSPEVLSFTTSQQLYVYRKLNGWAKVGLTETEQENSWWINQSYLK